MDHHDNSWTQLILSLITLALSIAVLALKLRS